MHLLSIQDGWTALMKAYDMGHMECVKMLLDKGSQINMKPKVSGIVIHWLHALQHVTRVPSGA